MERKFSILFVVLSIWLFAAPMYAQFNRDYTALYRFFNSSNGDHLYTTDCSEKNNVQQFDGYVFEGIEGYISERQSRRTMPLYRMLLSNGYHFYTVDEREVRRLEREDYNNRSEGIVGYVSERQSRDTVPFYRLYGKNHFYTTDEQEKNNYVRDGGRLESIAGYLFVSGQNPCGYNDPTYPTYPGNQYNSPTLYNGTNFDGAAEAIERDKSSLNDWDGSPNTIRSIRVPQGWYLVLYTKSNYRGDYYDLNSNITFAPGDRWYNRIRSIRVYRGNPPRQPR